MLAFSLALESAVFRSTAFEIPEICFFFYLFPGVGGDCLFPSFEWTSINRFVRERLSEAEDKDVMARRAATEEETKKKQQQKNVRRRFRRGKNVAASADSSPLLLLVLCVFFRRASASNRALTSSNGRRFGPSFCLLSSFIFKRFFTGFRYGRRFFQPFHRSGASFFFFNSFSSFASTDFLSDSSLPVQRPPKKKREEIERFR